MSYKHLSDDVNALVQGALSSLTIVNPSITFDPENKIVYHKEAFTSSNVAIVSGGGSGHEPAFAGLVGSGFLSAAVAGSVFASPSADQVYQCLLRLGSAKPERGILVIIMNYTGDKLHFGMAVEKVRAHGIKVELLVVGDDVGVGRSRSGRIGRRGLAGTVLVQKIAGALAANGASLAEVYQAASLAESNVATVGASLAHVHVPGRLKEKDELSDTDEIEIGMGIHNEEGFGRVKTTLAGLVEIMLQQLLNTSDPERGFLALEKNASVVLMINNLGGISQLELGAATSEVSKQLLGTYDIVPKRVYCGTYMSSLNGSGFSITLLQVANESFLQSLDTPVAASGWVPAAPTQSWLEQTAGPNIEKSGNETQLTEASSNLQVDPSQVQRVLSKVLTLLIAAEPEVTQYDTLVGDGDCGLCLKTGAEAVLAHVEAASYTDAVQLVTSIAHVVEKNMDGTSGALYAIFVSALASSMRAADTEQFQPATPGVWAAALNGALKTLGRYTPAQPGDRTVVDALQPFVEVFESTNDLGAAVDAATKGCESTKGMMASLGRSVYVGGEEWKNCPDPGAYGLVSFLKGFVQD
ncbi:putative dihydroxyacetone kinase protein [Paramyrothecium foliicola]|nr:putative dihydroxyacetone kinase protein [Paramyrothecium foliicola]